MSSSGHGRKCEGAAAARGAERAWAGLRAGAVARAVPLGWSVAARRVLRGLDRRLRRANAAAENRLVAVAKDFGGDPDFRKLARGMRALLRLERVWDYVRERGLALERKAEVLRTRRAELLAALGGEAALARWERSWDAKDGPKAARGSGEVPDGHDAIRPGAKAWGRATPRTPEGAARAHDALRDEFRLAGRPRRRGAKRASGSRSRRSGGPTRARVVRIPVWPEELRARDERRDRSRQVWTRGEAGSRGRSGGSGPRGDARAMGP